MLVKEKTVKSKNVKTNSIYKNMFVELFYPKELRRLIEKYRKEGTLNDVAVRNINKVIYYYSIFYFISSLIFIAFSDHSENSIKIIGITLLLLFPLLTKHDVHKLFYKQMAPYVLGKRIEARFVKAVHYIRGRGWIATYESMEKQNIVCKVGVTIAHFKEEGWPKENQITHIYQSKFNKNKGMPDIKFFKKNYSLTISIL
jgi:hypothetical protein